MPGAFSAGGVGASNNPPTPANNKPPPPPRSAPATAKTTASTVLVIAVTVWILAGPVTRAIYRRSKVSHSAPAQARRRQSVVQGIKIAQQQQANSDQEASTSQLPQPTTPTRNGRGLSLSPLEGRRRSGSTTSSAGPRSPTAVHFSISDAPSLEASASTSASTSGVEEGGGARLGTPSIGVSAPDGHFHQIKTATISPAASPTPSSAKKGKKGKGKAANQSRPSLESTGSSSVLGESLSRVANDKDKATETDPIPPIETSDKATQTESALVDAATLHSASTSTAAPTTPAAAQPLTLASSASPDGPSIHSATQTTPQSIHLSLRQDSTDSKATPTAPTASTHSATVPSPSALLSPTQTIPPRPKFDLHASFQATPPALEPSHPPSHSPTSYTNSLPGSSPPPSPTPSTAPLPPGTPSVSANRSRNRARKSNAAAAAAAAASTPSTERVVPGLPRTPGSVGRPEPAKLTDEPRGRPSASPKGSSKPPLSLLNVSRKKSGLLAASAAGPSTVPAPPPPVAGSSSDGGEEFWGPPPLQAWDARARAGPSSALALAVDQTGQPARAREHSVAWSDTSASMSDAGRNGSGSTRLTSPEASPCAAPRMVALQPNGIHQHHLPPHPNGTTGPGVWSPHASSPAQHLGPGGPYQSMNGFPIPGQLVADRPPSPSPSMLSQSTPGRFHQAQAQQHAQMLAVQHHQQQQQQLHQQQQAIAHAQAQAQAQAHYQHAVLMQLQAQAGAQQQSMHEQLRRRESESWNSHPASPAPSANGFPNKLGPPSQTPSALGFHPHAGPLAPNGFPHGPGGPMPIPPPVAMPMPMPSRQGSVVSMPGKAQRKNSGAVSPRSHQGGPFASAHQNGASDRGAMPTGPASEEWRVRLRQSEMEADRAGKELEIARWRLAVLEDEQRAQEAENQAALRALATRAQRAEARIKLLEDARYAAQAEPSAASASGSASPMIKPSNASDCGDVITPLGLKSSSDQASREGSPPREGHPLSWLDLDAVSFPAPQPISPRKHDRPNMLSASSFTPRGGKAGRGGRNNPYGGRPSGKANRRWSQGPASVDDSAALPVDDDDEVEIVLASSVSGRKPPGRKGSWREDESQPELSDDPDHVTSSALESSFEVQEEGVEFEGEGGVIGSLPGFLAVAGSNSAKHSPLLTAEPDQLDDNLSTAGTAQASGLPSFSLDTPSADGVGEVAKGAQLVGEGAEEKTPRVGFPASPGVEEGGGVELQAPSPKAVVPHALLSY